MYHEKRQQFYSNIDCFWADLYGEEYALYDVHKVTEQQVQEIRLVTERVGAIYIKAAELLRNVPDETLLEMGYPKQTLAFLRLHTLPVPTVIARLDLIAHGSSYKCIEINADTPTFIKELFHVNGLVCEEFELHNPNKGMQELLQKAVRASVAYSMPPQDANIIFTAHTDNIEDLHTVRYLCDMVPTARFVGLHDLQIERGVGLFDERGQRIDVLYRQTYPIENLLLDCDEDGNPIGEWLLELVVEGKLHIINPPAAFLLQNKAVQAIVWGLHEERSPYFTNEEHDWIAAYFLPTYFEMEPFIMRGEAFVKKPTFGREGDTVQIFNGQGELQLAEAQQSYTQYTQIYQQYIEQPIARFRSEKGEQTGQLLVGSFLLNGKAAAIGYRIGGQITNNLSYYLPIGVHNRLSKL